MKNVLFHALRSLLRPLVFSFLRLDARGTHRLYADGPLLLAGNHPTIVDGLVLALLAPRKVRFVAARELLKIPGLKQILRWLGAIPAGESAVEEAVKALRNGDLVAIFPEGRTSNGKELLPFRTGAQRIAELSGAPVLPFGIDGTQHVYPHGARWARPATVRLRIGAPTADLRPSIERLWRECRQPPQPCTPRQLAAGLLVVPLSLVATLLHATKAARKLQEDAC